MAHTRSSPPLSPNSSTASDEKGLPSLNELFPEDLFRGSLPQHNQPSTSFQPLSTQVRPTPCTVDLELTFRSPKSRPNPPLDSHSFPRQSPVLPGRSHPRGNT
ncbi:hypothetical protein BD309DRAFT_926283, partial [Dichomitus squalens]